MLPTLLHDQSLLVAPWHPALPQIQLCGCFPSQKTHEAVLTDCALAHTATACSLYKQGEYARGV